MPSALFGRASQQMIAKKTGAKLKFVGLNENQEFDVEV